MADHLGQVTGGLICLVGRLFHASLTVLQPTGLWSTRYAVPHNSAPAKVIGTFGTFYDDKPPNGNSLPGVYALLIGSGRAGRSPVKAEKSKCVMLNTWVASALEQK